MQDLALFVQDLFYLQDLAQFARILHVLARRFYLGYSNLARLAKILLVLPHSNVEPERLFSMVGKIETQSHSLLSSSTTCDLLTLKTNHDAPCFLSQDPITDDLLLEAKSATWRSLQRSTQECRLNDTMTLLLLFFNFVLCCSLAMCFALIFVFFIVYSSKLSPLSFCKYFSIQVSYQLT